VIALSQDCYNHPDLQELVHNLVRKDFRKVRKSIRKAGDAYEKALFADLVAPLFEDGQIDAALEKIEKKSRKEKARESYEAEQRLFFTRSSSIESLPDSDSVLRPSFLNRSGSTTLTDDSSLTGVRRLISV